MLAMTGEVLLAVTIRKRPKRTFSDQVEENDVAEAAADDASQLKSVGYAKPVPPISSSVP